MKRDRKWFAPVVDFKLDSTAKRICVNDKKSINHTTYEDKQVKSNNFVKDLERECAPKTVSDLAVNNKKLEELQVWIKTAVSNKYRPNSLLLLSGPSGCGKTAAVTLLAKDMKINLSEWVTPVDVEYVGDKGDNYYERQSDKFCNFLLKSSCYPSLLGNCDAPRIVMVEDFPNYLLKNPDEIIEVLQKFQEKGKSPLIFICSETNHSINVAWKLFPPHILERFSIHNISFNPIAVTNMKVALRRIVSLLSRRSEFSSTMPSSECIDGIINSSMGDIRSAINYFNFSLSKGTHAIQFTSTLKKPKKGGKKVSDVKLKEMGKDEHVSIMHGVGRVLNPKKLENDKFHHSPLDIAEQFQIQPSSFIGFIHENYLPHFIDIHCIERASDVLSDADCLLREWRGIDSKLYGLTVAVAGVMTANKSPVSCWHPLKAQRNIKTTQRVLENFPLLEQNQIVTNNALATDFKTYYDIIKESAEEDFCIEDFRIEDIEDDF